MRNIRVNGFCYLIVALLFTEPFSNAGNITSLVTNCDMHKAAEQCGKNERCYQGSKDEEPYCTCMKGFVRGVEECVQLEIATIGSTSTLQPDVKAYSGGSSVAAGLLIPTFLVVIGVLLYFGARRYKWLQRFRQLRPNHYGNVLVTRDDDDDDDPPIA